ncbi:hypothetical protein B0A48_16175 [Cryoendolithus antarcticus]|uniref:Uncharacterized protein n=1 Tax=Cryoendolithus antarcticus TaxID=1507870 RepID=A0A1V8SFD0_9PEZI|nr:hypothetical protein B0A48_16175 [Cryoendolithus antarcticus]
MRLFLLPISTRRTLIFCERVPSLLAPGQKPPLQERAITRATESWASWETKTSGWQKWVTTSGNSLFRRIPFEEWGLKTVPPLTAKRRKEVEEGNVKMEVLFPGGFVKEAEVMGTLGRIAKERQGWHRRKLWWSVGLMPVVAPFALVPVIPNLPFFYLLFRAYSHYRAEAGGRLLQVLLEMNLVTPRASRRLDLAYTSGLMHPSREKSRDAPEPADADVEQVKSEVAAQSKGDQEEVMLLPKWNGKLLAESFKLPEMEIEIERAVEQVEKSLKEKAVEGKQEEARQEGLKSDKAEKEKEKTRS